MKRRQALLESNLFRDSLVGLIEPTEADVMERDVLSITFAAMQDNWLNRPLMPQKTQARRATDNSLTQT